MVDLVQPAQDIFGLGRLAQSIRQNRAEKADAITRGLQQESVRLGIQEKKHGLADLAAGRQSQAELQTALSQNTGESQTLKALNFYKTKNPAQAQKMIGKTLEIGGKMSELNAQGGIDFINSELGTNWKIEEETPDTLLVDQGDKKVLIDKNTQKVLKEFPVTQKPTALIQNLEAAGLKQGTPAFNQALLSKLQGTGKTQTIEIGADGGIKIIEKTGLPEQKFAEKQKEAEIAGKKRAENSLIQADNVIKKVDQTLSEVDIFTTGFLGTPLGMVPGTPAKDLKSNIETIKANLAFNALNGLREASKTGGALGAVSERELSLLESQISSLDPAQSPEQIKRNLNEIKASFEDIRTKANQPVEQAPSEGTKVLNFDAQGNLIP